MPCGIAIAQRIPNRIRKPVESLRIGRIWYDGISRAQPADKIIVIPPCPHYVNAQALVITQRLQKEGQTRPISKTRSTRSPKVSSRGHIPSHRHAKNAPKALCSLAALRFPFPFGVRQLAAAVPPSAHSSASSPQWFRTSPDRGDRGSVRDLRHRPKEKPTARCSSP